MRILSSAKKAFWRTVRPHEVRRLEGEIAELSPKGPKSWYYHLDFGYGVEVQPELRCNPHSGDKNWRFLEAHLPPLAGKRVLDIGCNAGLYALRMADCGAAEVVGVDLDTRQAEFVRQHFVKRMGIDYSNVRYVAADAREFEFAQLGRFDLVSLYCVVYHLAEAADRVIGQAASVASTVALQGNLPRVTGAKYRNRSHQHLAGVPGMTAILKRHGLSEIEVVALEDHPKPVVIGRTPP